VKKGRFLVEERSSKEEEQSISFRRGKISIDANIKRLRQIIQIKHLKTK